MNKSILFVLHRIGIGGSMTSMLNLLELLKEQGYEIDLFLMEHEGVFLGRAKNAANLLTEDMILSSVICSKEKLIKSRNLIKLCIRLIYILTYKIFGVQNVNARVYKWRAKKLSGKYGNVIAFQENRTTEFVQYIEVPNKIAWVHNDFCRFVHNSTKEEMQYIYDKFQFIVCVSKASAESMRENLKEVDNKIRIIYNTLNPNYIKLKSMEKEFQTDRSLVNFVSIGRFVEQKKFERIVDVSNQLIKDGYKFVWYVIGNGDLSESIATSIKKNELGKVIKLLGAQENPYPMLEASDYLVITSLYEAHPMVANEALILHKPVISTAFSSVYEVINHRVNGMICVNSIDGLYHGIKELLDDKELQKTIREGAQLFIYDNDLILKQVSELLR